MVNGHCLSDSADLKKINSVIASESAHCKYTNTLKSFIYQPMHNRVALKEY